MFADTPSWLIDSSLWAGSITAVIVFLKVFTGWAPFQFVWKRLVHDPARSAMGDVVREQVEPMLTEVLSQVLPNGGSSFRDAVDATNTKLDEFMAYQHERNHDLINTTLGTSGRVMEVVENLDLCKTEIAGLRVRLDGLTARAVQVKSDLAAFNEDNDAAPPT